MPSTRLLDTRFRAMADALLVYARSLDPSFVFTSTYRSHGDQQRLYSRWLKGLSPFPALPPGTSQHERGLAVDLARLGVDAATDPLLAEVGAWWRRQGGVWGAAKDPVHFQAPRSLTGTSAVGSQRTTTRRRSGVRRRRRVPPRRAR